MPIRRSRAKVAVGPKIGYFGHILKISNSNLFWSSIYIKIDRQT